MAVAVQPGQEAVQQRQLAALRAQLIRFMLYIPPLRMKLQTNVCDLVGNSLKGDAYTSAHDGGSIRAFMEAGEGKAYKEGTAE